MELLGLLIGILLAVPVIVLLERAERKPDWYELECRRIQKEMDAAMDGDD